MGTRGSTFPPSIGQPASCHLASDIWHPNRPCDQMNARSDLIEGHSLGEPQKDEFPIE